MNTTTLQLTNSVNRVHIRLALLFIPLAYVPLAVQAQTCQQGCDLANNNTFLGDDALSSNTAGSQNTAIGSGALTSNTTGEANTAEGYQSLHLNTTGGSNTAIGWAALDFNTTGVSNTATGGGALFSDTTGGDNTANGENALVFNTIGTLNTATGVSALAENTTGNNNTANGFNALLNNRTGNNNIALGASAGSAHTRGNNNIDIGNDGVAGESNTIRIGTTGTQRATFIAGISGVTVPSGVGVIVGTDGKLGTVVSSSRFKDEIKPMDKASEAILALKPVTFRYKHELDPARVPQFGLVAEQVEKVNPDLVARDNQGKPYTVRYEAVNAMLLNEFLKEHKAFAEEQRKVQEQEATITQLKQEFQSRIAHQQKQIAALTVRLQKVSAQLELSRVPPKQS